MAYYDFLNVIFAPLFKLPDVWAIILVSLIVSILMTLVTKFMTDQTAIKNLKEETKEVQRQFKESRNNPQKLVELQKKQTRLMMEQFRHSFKPTLITLVPLFLIFGWMSSVFAYESIKPQQEFIVTAFFEQNVNGEAEITVLEGVAVIGNKTARIETLTDNGMLFDKSYKKATWVLKGEAGEHIIEVSNSGEKQQHTVLITKDRKYLESNKKTKGNIQSIQIGYKKKIIVPIGYKDWLGWLGTYILSSLVFTMALRKAMKVH
ncbi:MAG: EMC3/TMCO1 family protein [Nanoarchaeota archaeon]